ncbi:MAG: LysM peptidoglycan-binding domain-containing protein, partial [Rhodothermales bacterium]|nr:LysM peptidoglycan-binding domain-containing protein [Rhodothermales bacterium]
NSWVDERMDPEKSTRAAARHLRDLYQQYGNNWHVALAGYNCSPRCIKRAIAKAGGSMSNMPSYWDIYPYLPRETRGYVPQFIAFSLIMSNPDAFGLSTVRSGPRYAYDLVSVQGMLSLEDVARMAGTDLATIRALNPELVRPTLPPSNGAYALRLPPGTYDVFAAAFDDLPETTRRPVGEHTVRRGESLGAIASRYGVSVRDLKASNGLRSNTIHPGQRLVVPVEGYQGAASLADAQPVRVEYGSRRIRPIEPQSTLAVARSGPSAPAAPVVRTSEPTPREATPAATPARREATPAASTRVTYRVRRGDTLGKIASKYGVSVRQIQQWNSMRGTTIKVGQRLTLYADGNTASQPEYVIHKVRRGESLGKIASRYGTSVSNLKKWNNLRRNTIHPGQTLKIYR